MPVKTKIQRDNQENPGSRGKKNPICPPKQKITKTTLCIEFFIVIITKYEYNKERLL